MTAVEISKTFTRRHWVTGLTSGVKDSYRVAARLVRSAGCEVRSEQIKFACPDCGAENVQKVSVAWSAGVSDSRGRIGGLAFDGDGIVPAGGVFNSRSQTALSRQLEPPHRRNSHAPSIVLAGAIVGMLFFFWCITADGDNPGAVVTGVVMATGLTAEAAILAYVAHMLAQRYDEKHFYPAYEQWRRQWVCLRCGKVFEGKQP